MPLSESHRRSPNQARHEEPLSEDCDNTRFHVKLSAAHSTAIRLGDQLQLWAVERGAAVRRTTE